MGLKLTLRNALGLLGLPALALAHEGPTTAGEFVANRGQWDARARFAAPIGPGAWLFAEADGLTYALTGGLPDHEPGGAGAAADALPAHALRLEFVAPQPHQQPAGEQATAGPRHYLRGRDARRWAADVPAYQQVRYRALWPGTDLLLRANAQKQLEYDLLLAPAADPARIGLRYHGAERLYLDPETGRLQVQTPVGTLTEYRPQAWQTDPATGARQPVACAFRLVRGTVGFALGAYDRQRALTIDPAVVFVSYSGARVENWGYAATHDAAGNLYTAGLAFEPNYPTTTGAYQSSFAGQVDVVVVKYNPATSGAAARVWATYLGGSGLEFPHSLVVDGHGQLTLLGTTNSPDYPTTAGALGRSFRGGAALAPYGPTSAFQLATGADLVLTRLSASGGQLRASTYLGGTGTDGLLDAAAPAPRLRHNYGDAVRGDLALDAQGNVLVASVTGSADFPGLAAGAFRGGGSDGLVTCLDSAFRQTQWTTDLGGSGADAAYSLERDPTTGNIYVAGGTTSTDLGGSGGGYQAALAGGVDGFVARLSGTGQLLQTTYLGTASYDQAYFVRLGPGGKPTVLGQTLSNQWPHLDPLSYANIYGHQFIQQLSPDLRSNGFATVFGSGRATTDISPTAFAVDCYGRLLAAGWGGGLDPSGGNTAGLPTTPDALQRGTDTQDFYLIQLSDQARALDYATFFGSAADDHTDGGTSRFDPQGTLYQALCACNQSGGGLLLPPGAHTYAPASASPHCDNAALKLAVLRQATAAGPDSLTLCARQGPLVLGGSPAGGTWSGPGVRLLPNGPYVFTPDTLSLGPHVLTYVSPLTGLCAGSGGRVVTVVAQGTARILTRLGPFCLRPGVPAPLPVPLLGLPAGGVWSGPGVVPGTAVFDPVQAGGGVFTLLYTVGTGRCPAVARLPVVVRVMPLVPPQGPLRVCANDPPLSLNGSPLGGTWTGPGVLDSLGHGYFFVPSPALVGSHLLHYAHGPVPFCEPLTDSMRVVVRPVVPGNVTAPADTGMCLAGATGFALRGGLPAGGKWQGPGVTGSVAAGFRFSPALLQQAGSYALTYTGPVPDSTYCARHANRTVTLRADTVRLEIANPVICTNSGPQLLQATPGGGTWSGPGVSGSVAAGFVFTPTRQLYGYQLLAYAAPPSADPAACPAAGQLRVFVVQAPIVLIAPVDPVALCEGVPPHGVVLTATPAGGIFSGPGVDANRFNPAQVGPGVYVVSYTYQVPGLACPVVATLAIEVTAPPPVRLPADTVLCVSAAPFQLRASPGGTWHGLGVTPDGYFTPPGTPGTVRLTYRLPGNCGAATLNVTIPPDLSFTATWAAPACADNRVAPRRVRFAAAGPLAARVQWDFGDGSPPATGAVVDHSYGRSGEFAPRAAVPGIGAVPADCIRAQALPPVAVAEAVLPNVITPNGDGLNDAFAPRLGGCPGRLQVFSRWGQAVFDQDPYRNAWQAEGLPGGVYFYLLRNADGSGRQKGWVEVVR